ncbi:hypothetical protein NQ317_018437 [Molorchus minor]|uniref:Uncharacterized protein n=1 Tax=Molorchus minor TaxID=1323400 RepID=A0ABQ9JFU6_9CUCU|nr:hypothetical protein NQ317_018437 [Molorchus minor]
MAMSSETVRTRGLWRHREGDTYRAGAELEPTQPSYGHLCRLSESKAFTKVTVENNYSPGLMPLQALNYINSNPQHPFLMQYFLCGCCTIENLVLCASIRKGAGRLLLMERNALFWQRCNLKSEGDARGLQCSEDKIASLPNVGRDCGGCNYCNKQFLPTKSRSLYDIAYNRFKKWCAEKNVQVYSENVLLAYFSENAKNYKSSTLWAQYSMVKSCLIIYDNIDIA